MGCIDRPAGLHSPSLVNLAVDAIRKRILSGELEPGERLIEERLTRHLDISRPPLREALRLLENEGLIVTLNHPGMSGDSVLWEGWSHVIEHL